MEVRGLGTAEGREGRQKVLHQNFDLETKGRWMILLIFSFVSLSNCVNNTMATVIPPPSKRQKLEASERARTQADVVTIPDNLGSIRVQFVDQSTGGITGPVVAVPAQDATVRNLENLLNTLQGNVGTHSVRQRQRSTTD